MENTYYSVASTTPCSLIPNEASPSGRHGESTTLHIRVVPRPFLRRNLYESRLDYQLPCCTGMSHNITANWL